MFESCIIHTILYSALLLCRSSHTLPVTSIYVGSGGAGAVVVTTSLDRSCKIHRLSDGKQLGSITLPSALLSVVLDKGEHSLYAGAGDGNIYEVSLVGGEASHGASAAGTSTATSTQYARFQGHSKAVNSLAMSLDGEQLVSGKQPG